MDASCMSQHSVKLKKLLDNILRPDFHTKSDTNFNVLLSHISGKENPELSTALLSLDLFTEWIIQACTFWEENTDVHPSANVGRFILELTGIVSKNDERFLQLSTANAYLRLCDTFRVRKHDCVPSIKLAYVKLLQSFLEHKRGVEWIMATNSWTDVLNYCLAANTTVYVMKESYNFMYNLLESKVHFDEAFCNVVVKRILQPLKMNSLAQDQATRIDDEQLKKKLQPTLRLLIAILEQYFKNEWSNRQHLHIPRILFQEHHLLAAIETIMMLATNEELVFDLSSIAYLIHFISMCVDSKDHMIAEHEAIPHLESVFFLIEVAVKKTHTLNVLKLSYLTTYYWYVVHTRLAPVTHKDINKDPLIFQIQVVAMHILPIYHFIERQFEIGWNFENIDDLREFYVHKFMRQMCQYTLRLAYNYRKMLMTVPCNYQLIKKAMQHIIESRKYYQRQAAVVVFQALVYALNDFNACLMSDREQRELAIKEANFFFTFLYAMRDLIETFDFTWKDCVESICVVNAVLDFLVVCTWPTKLMAETFKLLRVSIVKYMSPNLALLVDHRTNDSSLGRLGPLLSSKLEDQEWEIRDSGLEVLATISELSLGKFPSFQEILLKENFPSMVLKLCLEDSESFVRASALKCLQQMIKSPVLWDEYLGEQDLTQKILGILSSETEGIVRLEAAALIRTLYLHQGFSEEKMPRIYEMMAAAVTLDLHWEVKTKALEFWDEVIWGCLKNQGMIDGKFPEVTFSKENRKIVTLNETEIRKRLQKVLVELSSSGCLAVLTHAIRDDCDVEVVQKATEVTKKLVALLEEYKMLAAEETTVSQKEGCEEREKVAKFLEFARQDLDKFAKNKRRWLKDMDSFSSLLDDMLRDYEEDEDVNNMDCY